MNADSDRTNKTEYYFMRMINLQIHDGKQRDLRIKLLHHDPKRDTKKKIFEGYSAK